MTVRGIEPEKGRLDLPGGFVEVGEHPRDALAREAKEELGVEVEVEERPMLLAVHTYGADGEYVLAIGFRVRIVSGEPSPADDVAEIRWVTARRDRHPGLRLGARPKDSPAGAGGRIDVARDYGHMLVCAHNSEGGACPR